MASLLATFQNSGKTRSKMRLLMIVLAALALGLLFLGLTLTIVGNWPGYTAWGGNPLKITGPALLAVGVIMLIGVIAACCMYAHVEEERQLDEKQFMDMPKSASSTPTVVFGETGRKPASSPIHHTFQPIETRETQYNSEVNVLNMIKKSPVQEKKYNQYRAPVVPMPTYPADTNGTQRSYSYDGGRNNNANHNQQQVYVQTSSLANQAQGPRKWGSSEMILNDTSKNHDSHSSVVSRKPAGHANKHKQPALHNPHLGRKSKKNNEDAQQPHRVDNYSREGLPPLLKNTSAENQNHADDYSKNVQEPVENIAAHHRHSEHSSRKEKDSSRDRDNEYHESSSRREKESPRDRRSRHQQGLDTAKHGRARSSSGNRKPSQTRHRSRSRDRESRSRVRDDVYNYSTMDYVTGVPRNQDHSHKSGRSRERNAHRGPRNRSRSHDKTSSSRGQINKAYHKDGQDSTSSIGHNQSGFSADVSSSGQNDLSMASGLLSSNKKQTLNFTINVNAQPGSAVQIALGNQQLPPARPMLPGSATATPQNRSEVN